MGFSAQTLLKLQTIKASGHAMLVHTGQVHPEQVQKGVWYTHTQGFPAPRNCSTISILQHVFTHSAISLD